MKTLTIEQFKSIASDKSGPAVVKASLAVKAEAEAESRVIKFIASDETVDRAGDVIKANGWRTEAYRRNPVMLWAHDASALPIGKAIDVKVENNALIIAVEFCTAEMNPLGEQCWQMYRGGFLSAVSVGFMPIRWNFVDDEERTLGVDFLEQELLELSAVPLPCNPNALITDARPSSPKHAPASVYLNLVRTLKENCDPI